MSLSASTEFGANPSSGAARHLLPQGEKATGVHHEIIERRTLRLARRLRRTTTPLEDRLWEDLRSRRFASFKFRRQVPMGRYVADFACYAAKLVIELDGSHHADSVHDANRDAELAQRGFRVLRFWNSDFVTNHRAVLDTIWAHLQEQQS